LGEFYGLCDVVDYDCAVCVAVVHWCKGFIAFLACCIPYFKFDCRRFIEGNRLRKERRSNLPPRLSLPPPKKNPRIKGRVPSTRDSHQIGSLQTVRLMNSTQRISLGDKTSGIVGNDLSYGRFSYTTVSLGSLEGEEGYRGGRV
jgi:hypothetical protein